jgi:hypothetical protein
VLTLRVSVRIHYLLSYPSAAGTFMMVAETAAEQATPVGTVYANITLSNPHLERSVSVRAVVDTGATHMIVTADIARELGTS